MLSRKYQNPQEGQGFYNTFLLQKDSGFREISNLRNLTSGLVVPQFKMETVRRILCAFWERRLGSVDRSQGCTLSCSSPSAFREVPSIMHTGQAFPITRNAVWIGDSAKDIHQTNVRCGKLPDVTSDTNQHVNRRLVHQKSGQSNGS